MKPGREMDKAVAIHVFGMQSDDLWPSLVGNERGKWQVPKHYSTEIAAAWEIVDHLIAIGHAISLDSPDHVVSDYNAAVVGSRGNLFDGFGPTMPVAICWMALAMHDIFPPEIYPPATAIPATEHSVVRESDAGAEQEALKRMQALSPIGELVLEAEGLRFYDMPPEHNPLKRVQRDVAFSGDRHFLSNFYVSPIEHDGETYETAEHLFQALKGTSAADRARVRIARTPGGAKRAGRQITLRADWEQVRIDVMRYVLRLKFTQHPDLAQKLEATGMEELVETNTWGDVFWGTTPDREGQNWLGKLLMELRATLRSGHPLLDR